MRCALLWHVDVKAYRAVSFRKKGPFHSQHTSIDEALPGHEVEHAVQLLYAAHTHQPMDDDVQSTFLGRQHFLLKKQCFVHRKFYSGSKENTGSI